jgi:hypothetical protein
MVKKMTEREKLGMATRYRPLLVLYPEIELGSQRKSHYHSDYGVGNPPLDQDYHPRDVKLALDHAAPPEFLRGVRAQVRTWLRLPKPARAAVLETMSNNEVGYIDILPGARPSQMDKFWDAYANIKNRDEEYPRKAYARIVPGTRRYADFVIIQYWLAYFFDDWANVHEMDWEMVSVVVKNPGTEDERPVACAYRAHAGGFRAPWKDVEKAGERGQKAERGKHPIAYIANGSHASYFHDDPVHSSPASAVGPRLGRLAHCIPWIKKNFSDYVPAFDEGEKHFLEIEVMPEPNKKGDWVGDWRWLNFTGRWGSKGRLTLKEFFTLPFEEHGPPSLKEQGICWEDPFAWIGDKCFNLEERSWLIKTAGRGRR